jgi:hypothetical protein
MTDPRPNGQREIERKEVIHMLPTHHHLALSLQVERRRVLRERARHGERLPARLPRRSVRRAVGRSMVRIGTRIAAEPAHQPARSR